MKGLRREVWAVIFDLDGVLLESEQVWSAAKRSFSLGRGGTWTAEAEGEMLGMSSAEWARYMQDELGVRADRAEISAGVAELVAVSYRQELPVIPGADDAVRLLSERCPVGLASSSNRETIDLVLELAGWSDRFTATTSSEEVAAGKPAPDVYVETMARLGATAQASAAVEDSDVGIRAALAAEMAVVAIPNRAHPPAADTLLRADLVLDSIAGLVARAGG